MVEPLSFQASFWLNGKELAGIVASYFLGCFASGYYLVRWRTGADIRTLGSGNIGAKNVGRVLGPNGFAITFLLDVAKGATAMTVASLAQFRPWALVAVMLAVVAGHNWPVQLGLQGGKGISASLGALLVFNYALTMGMAGAFLIIFAFYRRFTPCGLAAYACSPLLAWLFRIDAVGLVGVTALTVMVLLAHHENLREELVRLRPVAK